MNNILFSRDGGKTNFGQKDFGRDLESRQSPKSMGAIETK